MEALFLPKVGRSASLATSTTSSSLYKFIPINSHHTSTMAPRKAAKKGNVARSAAATAAAKFNSKCANTPAVAATVAASAAAAAALAGNVGDMSATCWQHVEMSINLGIFACGCRHQNSPDTRFLCQKLPTLYQIA
jgi:hypothetical protein